jgi:hypothetical protein
MIRGILSLATSYISQMHRSSKIAEHKPRDHYSCDTSSISLENSDCNDAKRYLDRVAFYNLRYFSESFITLLHAHRA